MATVWKSRTTCPTWWRSGTVRMRPVRCWPLTRWTGARSSVKSTREHSTARQTHHDTLPGAHPRECPTREWLDGEGVVFRRVAQVRATTLERVTEVAEPSIPVLG